MVAISIDGTPMRHGRRKAAERSISKHIYTFSECKISQYGLSHLPAWVSSRFSTESRLQDVFQLLVHGIEQQAEEDARVEAYCKPFNHHSVSHVMRKSRVLRVVFFVRCSFGFRKPVNYPGQKDTEREHP